MSYFSRQRAARASRTFLIGMSLWTGVMAADVNVNELRNRAKAAFRSGNYDTASSLYKQIAALSPDRLSILKEAMWAMWNMGEAQSAKELAEAVQKVSPDDAEAAKIISWGPAAIQRERVQALQDQAKASYQSGDYNQASELYAEILSLDPNNVSIMRDRMWLLWNMKRLNEAAEIALKIQALRPGDRDAQNLINKAPEAMARLRPDLQSNGDKLARARTKVSTNPGDSLANRQLAWLLFNRGRTGEGQQVLKIFLKNIGDDSEVWLQLGKMQMNQEDYASAIVSLQKSIELKPEQPAVMAALGRSYMQERNIDGAVKWMERAVDRDPEGQKALLSALGKALFFRGEYRRSAETWADAVKAFPDRPAYRYTEAEALYYAGEQGNAIAKMRALLAEKQDTPALLFLRDEALSRKDYATAIQLIQDNLKTLTIQDERDVYRLTELYLLLNKPADALALLKKWLAIAPNDVVALLKQGSIYQDQGRNAEALTVFNHIIQINPYIVGAYLGKAEAHFAEGDKSNGLKALQKARDLEPTDPATILRTARGLFNTGDRQAGRKVLTEWLSANTKDPILPILLYHGLTPFEYAPMLAYQEHMRTSRFEDQIAALSAAGYTPVTLSEVLDWYAGKATLPAKPVFVTFDDARVDGFRLGDAILSRYNFKATMFVPTGHVDSRAAIGYASWPVIRQYQATGRWELQAHGAKAHNKIVSAENGRTSLFLTMPQWLPREKRVETNQEWTARINADHEESRRALKQETNTTPIGYAYPEGLFGHRSDNASAVPLNVTAVKKFFRSAFYQDDLGLNVRSQDPYFLHRVEPKNDWSGQVLLKHIADNNPVALAYQELIVMELTENHIADANKWYDALAAAGASESLLNEEKARIAYASGDSTTAYDLTLKSLTTDANSSAVEMMTKFEKTRTGAAWRPHFAYSQDSQHRSNFEFAQSLEFPLTKTLRARLFQSVEQYRERGEPRVNDGGLGAGFGWSMGLRHDLNASAIQHSLSGTAHDLVALAADYRGQWTNLITTRLGIRRDLYGSARAINANVRETRTDASVHIGATGDWGLLARGRYSTITDNNTRQTYEGEYSLPLFTRLGLDIGPVFRYTADNMKKFDPRFYSPRHVKIGEVGPQLAGKPVPSVRLLLRYLPGYADEEGLDRQFVQSVVTEIRWNLAEQTSLSPSFSYGETASYHQAIGSIEFEHRF